MNTFSKTHLRWNCMRTAILAFYIATMSLTWAQQDQQHLAKGLLLDTPAIPTSRIENEVSRDKIFEDHFNTESPGWVKTGGWRTAELTGKAKANPLGSLMAASNSSASYDNNSDAWLISPRISLSAPKPGTRFTLRLHEWFELESGYDFGYVKVSPDNGANWITVSVRDGKNDGREHEIDLTSFAGQEIRIAFHLVSDASNAYAGWHISSATVERSTSAALNATLTTLNSQNFPFIYTHVAVTGEALPILPQNSFVVRENGILQTDFFSVTPPGSGDGVRIADIIFLIDDTGSMLDEIVAVRNNVNAFLTALQSRSIDYALGLVTFKDNVTMYNGGILTKNVTLYRNWIDALSASGGGDIPENSFGALNVALSSISFRPGAQKVFILITDAPSQVPPAPSYVTPPPPSLSQINNSMVSAGINCYAVAIETSQYVGAGSITSATRGRFFNVTSPFNSILDDITTIVAGTYIITYQSSNPLCDGVTRNVAVTVTHAGESATASGSYIPCAVPRIQRTPATINLSNSAQVAGVNLTIAAEITDPVAPFVQSATLFYRTTGAASYVSKPMTVSSGSIYQAVIFGSSVQSPGIDYYISATDGAGTATDPAVDPQITPHQIAVTPNQPPLITHTPIIEAPIGANISISANVTDNTNFLSSVILYYRRFGTLLFSNTTMPLTGGSQYQAVIPGSEMTEAGVEYYIRAIDNFGVASVHGIHVIAPDGGPEPPCETSTFTDDFNDGNANGWKPDTPSQWIVANVEGDPAYVLNVPDASSDEFSVLQSHRVNDFTLTLSAKATAADNKNFFILFGVNDLNNPKRDGYYLQFGVLGVRLYRIVANSGSEIASHPLDFASDNSFHTITIRRSGAKITAHGDGILVIDVDDATFTSGYVGFGSFKSTACFDDVNLTSGSGSDTFTDNFDDGNANGWTPLTPSRWQVSNDAGSLRYYLNTSNYNSPDDKRLGELSLINSQTWGDFTFECDAKSEDAGIGNSGADLSIVFGYQDFDSYYYVNYNREPGFTEMHRIHDGSPRVTLATYNAPTFVDGNYHKLRIEREGSVIRAYFDGILILSGNDSFFGEGRIGVGSFNDAGYFDNIVITGCKIDGLPNLLGTALSFSQTTYKPGDAITFTGTVMNNGSSPTRPDFRINVFLTDSPTEPDYSLLVHSFTMPALDAGNSNSFTQIGTIPPTTPADTYYLWMNIDVDDRNPESNEDDNSFRTSTQLTVTRPDPLGGIKPIVSNPVTSCAEYFVDIRVENVTNLFGASFVLNYTNTAYVNYVSSENGAFLGNDVLLYANPEDPLGKVSIGITRKTGQPGSTGSGVIVRVKFSSPTSTPVGTPVTFSITDIVAIDPLNNSIALTPQSANTVLSCGTAVWPGDTNNDGVVNQADVLPLGLHWNRTGSARSGGSCAWSAQLAAPWTPLAATYADANGDGIVNQADVLCIGLNWNRTHTAASGAPLELANNTLAKAAFAQVFAEAIPAQLLPGQEFIIKIQAAEARNLFGLAFELQNDRPELLQILSVEPEALFGHEALLYSHLEESGKSGIGITRKNGQPGAQGAGAVIRLKGKISNQARLGEVITLTLNDVVAQDHEGHTGVLSSSSLQLVIGAGANVALQRSSRMVTEYQLYQNYPNPFNPETMLAYDILEAGRVTLQIFNTVGQVVRTLINETQSPGAYQVRWDGRNTFGQALPSGVYFYRLQAGEFVQIRKMTLVQ